MSTPQFWGSDSPSTGAYRENEVAEIFKPAGFASLLFQLADKRQVASGQSLTVPAYQNLSFPTSTVLEEDQTIPLSKLTVTAKTISMSERGRAVAITGKAENRSPWDILQGHKDAIQTMMSRELEEVVATALKLMPVKYVCDTASAAAISTNGTPAAAADSDVNIFHMQNIGRYLSDTLRVPMRSDLGAYAGIFRGLAIMNIQRDSEYRELHRGTGLSHIENLSVGKIADTVLYKHNDSRVLSAAIGTGTAFSEGLVLGQQAVLFGFIEQIGLYYDFGKTKATEFGRFKYIAMLGDYGAGLWSDSANADLARGLHVSSS